MDRRCPRQWAAHRAAASAGGGSDGGAWLDGDAAAAMACDAAMAPIVTGEVNPAVLEDLIRLCVQLDKLRYPDPAPRPRPGDTGTGTGTGDPGESGAGTSDPGSPGGDTGTGSGDARGGGPGGQGAPASDTTRAWEALEQAVIGKAVDLLSGPGGLAGFLRRRQLGARLAGPSLPLDIGMSESIPASIRNAVILRDRHCQWAGRCNQPATACEVHHVRHKKTAARPAPKTAFCCVSTTTRSSSPVGLDPGPEPRRRRHRLEQRQDESPA